MTKLYTVVSVLLLLFTGMSSSVRAETPHWNMVFGLTQPILFNGGNIELNYMTENWIFEYSHGFDLDLDNTSDALTAAEKKQGLKIHLPYSTGGGIGYRFTKEFNLRIELKQHKFEVSNKSAERIDYTTQDLGIGAYYFYKPFNTYSLIIVPSLRYWPTINTSLKDDQYTFKNGDVHEAHEFGLFANVAVGWQF